MSYGRFDVRMVYYTIPPEAQTTIIKDSREATNYQNKNTNIGITNNLFINMNRAM